MPLRSSRLLARCILPLGLLLLACACGETAAPDAAGATECVRTFVEAARAGDLEAAGRCLHPRIAPDARCLEDNHRRWTRVLDTCGLELGLHDVLIDGECALVPYRLTGTAERAAAYSAGLFTLRRADGAWKIVSDEVAEGSWGPPLAPFAVYLPRATVGGVSHSLPPALVHVAAGGRIWMDGSTVADEADLRDRLAARARDPWPGEEVTVPNTPRAPEGLSLLPLVLRADRAVVWSRIASLLRTACDPGVLVYQVSFRTTRENGLCILPREIRVWLLDPGYNPYLEDPRTPCPLLVVEMDSGGRGESTETSTTARVAGGEPVAARGAPLREALGRRWAAMRNDPDTLGVIRVASGAGDRIPLEDVVAVLDALVELGLEDVRFEGLACVPPEGSR